MGEKKLEVLPPRPLPPGWLVCGRCTVSVRAALHTREQCSRYIDILANPRPPKEKKP